MFLASSEVPQEGHLSPLLFSLFVDNVSHILHQTHLLCFADDMKIDVRIKNFDDCGKQQSDVSRFIKYFNLSGLSLNISKC